MIWLSCILATAIASLSDIREEAIMSFKSIDVSASPEKFYLIEQAEIFLMKLETVTPSTNEDPVKITQGLIEAIRHVVLSNDVYSERQVNILSRQMEALYFSQHPNLTTFILRLHIETVNSGLDLLSLLPTNTIPNQESLVAIYSVIFSTPSAFRGIQDGFILKFQSNAETFAEQLRLQYSHYTLLQNDNADFPIYYLPMQIFLEELFLNRIANVHLLMRIMDLFVPIARQMHNKGEGEIFVKDLFKACYSRGTAMLPRIEEYLVQLYQRIEEETDIEKILEAIESTERLIAYIPIYQSRSDEVVSTNAMVAADHLTPPHQIALRIILNRLAGTESNEFVRMELERFALIASPAQIVHLLNFIQGGLLRSDISWANVVMFAKELGLNFFDSRQSLPDDAWKAEYISLVIARDPRIYADKNGIQIHRELPPQSSEMANRMMGILSKYRRVSFGYEAPSRLLSIFLTTIAHLDDSRSDVADRIISELHQLEGARDVVQTSLISELAGIVLDDYSFVMMKEYSVLFSLLNRKTLLAVDPSISRGILFYSWALVTKTLLGGFRKADVALCHIVIDEVNRLIPHTQEMVGDTIIAKIIQLQQDDQTTLPSLLSVLEAVAKN